MDRLDLWTWVRAELTTVERDAPTALHSQYGDREDWGSGAGLIRGLPFSRAFLRRLQGGLPPSRLADAARRIGDAATTRIERVGADIVRQIVAGETDPLPLRRRSRLSEAEFRVATRYGLAALQREIESPHLRDDLTRQNDDLRERQRMMRSRQTSSPTV